MAMGGYVISPQRTLKPIAEPDSGVARVLLKEVRYHAQIIFLEVCMQVLKIGLALTCLMASTAKAGDIDPNICGVGGAIAGAAVGHQFGGGDGKKALTILGGILGAVAAHNYCKQADNSDDIGYARESERQMLERNSQDYQWSNPRFGRDHNSHSRIERRGYYGQRQCTMTRSVMRDRGGSYVNETYWCQDSGRWSQVTETTTIQQIQWGANGPVQTTTTTTVTSGGPQMPPGYRPSMPSRIVSENRMARFESEVQSAWPYHDRAAMDIAGDLSMAGQVLTLDQLGSLLAIASFDSGRNKMLRHLAEVVDQRYGSISNALRSYTFDSYRAEAMQILSPVRRDEPGRHGRHVDERDGRDFGRDQGRPRRW